MTITGVGSFGPHTFEFGSVAFFHWWLHVTQERVACGHAGRIICLRGIRHRAATGAYIVKVQPQDHVDSGSHRPFNLQGAGGVCVQFGARLLFALVAFAWSLSR